jgi:Uncharacterized protein conserved in bacteria (DUF2066)
MNRDRVFFALRLLLAVGLAGLAPYARAASVPALYSAVVPDSDPQQAAQSAMALVLVRLTGTRTAAADPALASLISDARKYVQIERSTTSGSTQVLFDGTALRAALTATGTALWNADRPLVWIAIPAQDAAANDALRTRLQNAAQARGLPIMFAGGLSGEDAGSAQAALAAARRAGAAAALVAQSSPSDPGELQWTLAAAGAEGHWSGAAEAALDGATDALVRAARVLDGAPATELDCHIVGIADLPGFASVFSAIGNTPGVAEVTIREIAADGLTLHLKARGSEADLARVLASDGLHALGGGVAAGTLEYRYQAVQ